MLAHRHYYRGQPLCVIRVIARDPLADRQQVRLRLFNRYVGLHSRDNGKVMIIAIRKLLLVERRGHPKAHRALQKLKACRHHADDRILLTIEENVTADYVRLGAVTPLPQTVTENGDLGRSRLVFFSQKTSANRGLHSKQRIEIRRNAFSQHPLGVAISSQIETLGIGVRSTHGKIPNQSPTIGRRVTGGEIIATGRSLAAPCYQQIAC